MKGRKKKRYLLLCKTIDLTFVIHAVLVKNFFCFCRPNKRTFINNVLTIISTVAKPQIVCFGVKEEHWKQSKGKH